VRGTIELSIRQTQAARAKHCNDRQETTADAVTRSLAVPPPQMLGFDRALVPRKNCEKILDPCECKWLASERANVLNSLQPRLLREGDCSP